MSTTLTGLKRVSRGVVSYRGFLIVSFLGKKPYVRSTKYIRMYAVCTPWDADKRFKGHDPEDFSKGRHVGQLALRYHNLYDLDMMFEDPKIKVGTSAAVKETKKEAKEVVDRLLDHGSGGATWACFLPVYREADIAWLKAHPEEVPLLLAQWPESRQLKELMEAS